MQSSAVEESRRRQLDPSTQAALERVVLGVLHGVGVPSRVARPSSGDRAYGWTPNARHEATCSELGAPPTRRRLCVRGRGGARIPGLRVATPMTVHVVHIVRCVLMLVLCDRAARADAFVQPTSVAEALPRTRRRLPCPSVEVVPGRSPCLDSRPCSGDA
jgi:hypothetical protein